MSENALGKSTQKYLVGLDMIRICSMMFILAFHTNILLGNTYGLLTPFIEQGAIFCSVFFMISGFSIYYSNRTRELYKIRELANFYKKRAIAIIPAYIIVWLGYYFIFAPYRLAFDDRMALMPIEFLGLRCELLKLPCMSFFWFVSCIMLCYLVYPFIQIVIKQLSFKHIIILMTFAYSFLLYSNYLEERFGTNPTYYIPFIRILELLLGVSCCRLSEIFEDKFNKKRWLGYTFITVAVLIFIFSYKICLRFKDHWMWYDIFIIPCMCIILFFIKEVEIKNRFFPNIVKRISGISYEVYLVQTWVLAVYKKDGLLSGFYTRYNNFLQVLLCTGGVIALAIFLKIITKRIVKFVL